MQVVIVPSMQATVTDTMPRQLYNHDLQGSKHRLCFFFSANYTENSLSVVLTVSATTTCQSLNLYIHPLVLMMSEIYVTMDVDAILAITLQC